MANLISREQLAAGGFPGPRSDQLTIPEPRVKELLAGLGVHVPKGVVVDTPRTSAIAVSAMAEPLVLKAWGGGIVHKTDLGAVQLGLHAGELDDALHAMRTRLAAREVHATGYLVEEQVSAGVELLLGVVHKPPFGHLLAVGMGGVLAELLDEVAVRLCPISRFDAQRLIDGFRGAELLAGYRGGKAVNRNALVELLLAIAGPEGLVAQLGDALVEFECNPVIVTEHSAVVADARLILSEGHRTALTPTNPGPLDVSALFMPRTVAIAGASTKRTTVANRALRRYRDLGWQTGLYAIHPTANEIEGVPAYPSLAEVPGGVDYFAVMLPAASCPEAIRAAKGHTSFVHVLSSGFGEADGEGKQLDDDLRDAVRQADVRLVGPNSLGTYCPTGGQSWANGLPTTSGCVGGVFQSGGLAGDVVYLCARAGIYFNKAVSCGNSADLTVGMLASALLDDDAVKVLALHVEGGADEALIDTLRRARHRTPVVLLATGLSTSGARTAASHTGAMTSDRRSWAAVTASTGAVVVETLESFTAVLRNVHAHLQCRPDWDDSLLVLGVGGGASVLAADACDHEGLELSPCTPDTVEALTGLGFSDGVSLGNPVDLPIFQGTRPELLRDAVMAALSRQPFTDVLLHVDVATYFLLGDYSSDMPRARHLVRAIEELGAAALKHVRLSLVARNLDAAPGPEIEAIQRASQEAGLPLHRTFTEAAFAISAERQLARHRKADNGNP